MNIYDRIVVATDKFRGSLSAGEAAEAVREGLPGRDVKLRPMADGGEGSLNVVRAAFSEMGRPFRCVSVESVNHRGQPVSVPVLLFDEGRSAFVEMASVCGLNLVPRDRRDLLHSTTYGFGEVLRILIEERNVRKMVLAIGGSGTNDGGFGLLTALGYRYRNTSAFRNRDIASFLGCVEEVLDDAVATVSPHLGECTFRVANDVTNPLLGRNGATLVYGRQKGGTPDTLNQLESALHNWACVVERYRGEKGLARIPGSGAAGGTGFALHAVLGARLMPGWKLFADLLHLEEDIAQSDLVITGEGKFDRQSLSGKLVSGMADLCRRHGKPLIVVTGRNEVSEADSRALGILRVIDLTKAAGEGESSFRDAAKIIAREMKRWL